MKRSRIYSGRDIDMLTTCGSIVEHALDNQDFLAAKRSTWAPPYFEDLKKRIDNALQNFIGIDSTTDQRRATRVVLNLQTDALNGLAEVKVQLMEDFKSEPDRRDEILRELGYTAYYTQAQQRNQESLVQLLYHFKTALTPELESDIAARGTSPETLALVASYADQLANADIRQETLKADRKSITEENVDEFNAIYSDVISVAKIAHNFYKGDPAMQDKFSYSKIATKL